MTIQQEGFQTVSGPVYRLKPRLQDSVRPYILQFVTKKVKKTRDPNENAESREGQRSGSLAVLWVMTSLQSSSFSHVVFVYLA